MEWSTASRAALRVWHHALNNDLPIAPVGGEDSITNLHRTKLVGTVRTYAYVGKPDPTATDTQRNANLTAENWIQALKRGRTVFSSGPLLEFQVNDRLPGEALNLPPTGGDVVLKGEVWSLVPLARVVIYRNGQQWKEISLTGDHRSARFQERVRLDQSSWLSLTAEAGPASHPLDVVFPQAATNAIRIYVGDQKIRSRESAQYFIRWIEKLQSMAEAWPGWRSQREKDHVFGQFREARQVYERFSKEAGENNTGSLTAKERK
jgi:hypothetical protein